MLSLHLSTFEQERSRALPMPVSLKPKLVKSLPRVVNRRMQLIVPPGPPLIKDVIEEAEVPRLENASDAADEPVEMQENLHPAPVTLEDDELERKSSHWTDVPLHRKRSRKGSLPQIQGQPVGTGTPSVPGDGAGGRRQWNTRLGIITDSRMCEGFAGTRGFMDAQRSW